MAACHGPGCRPICGGRSWGGQASRAGIEPDDIRECVVRASLTEAERGEEMVGMAGR
jgi:hypothetical protein